jgi:DNA-binding Lrp family transcriptional regulator
MVLKPQDVVVVLKLCRYEAGRPPFSQIAAELGMSPSEVHGAVKRAQAARLLHGSELGEQPNISALVEFVVHGLKYAFPAELGQLTRGIPTAHAAEPLKSLVTPGSDPPPVWPYGQGDTRGTGFSPLYPSVPVAALRDPELYELLALCDALRDGRSRDREIAEHELIKRLRKGRRA